MGLDQLLTRIGEFTRYQRRLLALLCLVGFPAVLHEKGPLFWASAGSFYCDTSSLTPPRVNTASEDFVPSRRWVAVVSEDQCSVHWKVVNGTGSGAEDIPDNEPCTAWIYEHPRFKSTLMSEWHLVCTRAWLLRYVTGLYITGQMVGSFMFGVIIDRYGRRKPLALLAALQIALSIAGAAMPEIYSYLFIRFLLGVVTSGHIIVALIIVTEIMSPRWRMAAVTIYFSSTHVGAILLCGIATVMKDRLLMQLVCCLPLLPLLLHIRYVPESPRWLITAGHVTLGRKILLKMADNKDIDLKEDINSQAMQEEDSLRQPFVLCKSGILLSRLMWNSYVWFVLGILMRRLTLDTQYIHRDERVVLSLLSAVDLIMLGTALFLSYRFGRRGTLATLFVVMGVSMQCLAPIPKELAQFGQGLVMACRLLVTCPCFLYILNFLGCFPTNARGLSVGFGYSTFYAGNCVASTLPHLAAVHPALGYVLLGGLCVLSSLIAVFLPDSQSASLPDVTEEAEEIPGRITVCIFPDPLPPLPRALTNCDVRGHALRRSTLMPAPTRDAGSTLEVWKSQDGGYVWDDIVRSASL